MSPRTSSKAVVGPRRRGPEWTDKRRSELLDAAGRTIRRVGPGASMEEIAAEAQVARVVLYRYFDDKLGLYGALGERYVDELRAQLRAALEEHSDPAQRLRAGIAAYVAYVEEHRDVYDFLMHRVVREGPVADAAVSDFMRKVAADIGEVLARDMAILGFDTEPAEVWAHGVVGMVHLAADRWLRVGDMSRDRFVDHLTGLLSYGFFGLAENPQLALSLGFARARSGEPDR